MNVQYLTPVPSPPFLRAPGRAFPAGPSTVQRNLILVQRDGWQSVADWAEIGRHVVDIDPRIQPYVVRHGMRHSYTRRQAGLRPTLVFSPGPLGTFQPVRGKVYHGRPIAKLEQLRRLQAAGVPIPKTAVLTPDLKLDPAEWGEFVIVKPTDLATSSHGQGIQLMRTGRVRFMRPQDYPARHPGRRGPMVVQQFVNTGERIALYRVLTLFGTPLYSQLNHGSEKRVDLGASDEEIESAVVATQAVDKDKDFVVEDDVLAVARAAHAAMPEVPQKGIDIIREATTGALYVLEVNPGGNTWHFSSQYLAKARKENGPEFERRRVRQFDAFRAAARTLVERTNAEAE